MTAARTAPKFPLTAPHAHRLTQAQPHAGHGLRTNLLLVWMTAIACGCGGAVAPAVSAAPTPRPLGELALLVPEGATFVIVAHPAALFDSTVAPRIVETLVVPGGLDRFAVRTGVDVRRLTEAVYAEYDGGASLLLVRGPIDAALVVAESGERMSVVESRADEPLVRRAGFFTDERRELVALDHDVVVITGGAAVPPLAALLGCVTSRERRCRSAFSGQDAAALLSAHRAAPLAIYAPTGLTLPEGFGTTSLLAGTRALAACVRLASADAIDINLDLRGRFPVGAETNFRTLALSLGASDLGAMVGLRLAADRVTTTRDASGLHLQSTVDVAPLVHGLEVLFAGEIRAILGPSDADSGAHPRSPRDAGATIENHK